MIEAEIKIPAVDLGGIGRRIILEGGSFLGEKEQTDIYLSHPCRDMKARDEALRVRRDGGAWRVTFKGARLGGLSKRREEIEFAVLDGDKAIELFKRLGFSIFAVVRKRRREYELLGAKVALDTVEGLGDFVEIEFLESGAEGGEGKDKIIETVAQKLGLGMERSTTESYVEMLASRSSLRRDSK